MLEGCLQNRRRSRFHRLDYLLYFRKTEVLYCVFIAGSRLATLLFGFISGCCRSWRSVASLRSRKGKCDSYGIESRPCRGLFLYSLLQLSFQIATLFSELDDTDFGIVVHKMVCLAADMLALISLVRTISSWHILFRDFNSFHILLSSSFVTVQSSSSFQLSTLDRLI